jgi:DNA-directed RNA polymerase specialized sigma subunit
MDNSVYDDSHNFLEMRDFIMKTENLNTLEKNILIGKYIFDYTDIELSKILNITRITLFKHKKKALNLIKEKIDDDFY